MQKISVFLALVMLSFSEQIQAVDDNICFKCTYLTETMRWVPKNCFEAKEALSNFDQEANGLSSLHPAWTKDFVQNNRDAMVARVQNLCKNS